MAKGAHVMMVPYPAQGHVIPLLELAHTFVKHHPAITITFVNVEFIHDLVGKNTSGVDDGDGRIRFVSVPDGMEPEDRFIPEKFIDTMWRVVPQKIEELVQELNVKEEENKVTCLVCDYHLCMIKEVADRLGIKSAFFSILPAATLVSVVNVQKLIDDGTVDNEAILGSGSAAQGVIKNTVREGGNSYNDLKGFLSWIQED